MANHSLGKWEKSPGNTWAKMQSYPTTRVVSTSVNRNEIRNEMQTTK
jgi:hypothetical protein